MLSLVDCCRLPWRTPIFRLSYKMLIPIIVQPFLVLLLSLYAGDSVPIVSSVVALLLLLFMFISRRDSRSQIYYYWTASSITYVIIVFENIVVPLSEIESEENFFLIVFITLAFLCLYLTKTACEECNNEVDAPNGVVFGSEILTESCPVCRSKTNSRSYHCHICQICFAKYDYHCYWLNCCIGECNQHFFVVGVFFSMVALGYASLLILTTICEPEFFLGILLPRDCSDVDAATAMFTCFVCGIYCMESSFLLLLQLIHQVWLINSGHSSVEWRENSKYSSFRASPHSTGFFKNWLHFFRSLRKM